MYHEFAHAIIYHPFKLGSPAFVFCCDQAAVGMVLQFEFTNGYEMMHKVWSSIEKVPYSFSRSSVKFQGHTGQKEIINFDPNWAFSDCNSSLNSLMVISRGQLPFGLRPAIGGRPPIEVRRTSIEVHLNYRPGSVENNLPEILITRSITFLLIWSYLRG